jgi:hypothetical protein
LNDFLSSFCDKDRSIDGKEQKKCEFVVPDHKRSLALVLGAKRAISVLLASEYLPISLIDTLVSILSRKYEIQIVSPALSFD